MKNVLKIICKIVVFFGILYVLYIPVDKVLGLKTENGIMQSRALYDQPKDTIDVVFMGSSHTHMNVNTASLWIDYGIAGYDYSGAEQTLWMTYHYLKEICKYQNPKLVVLDMSIPTTYTDDDYHYGWIYENLGGFRFSLNKLQMLMVSTEFDRVFEFFPSIVVSHNRYLELTDEDYEYLRKEKERRGYFKGYTPRFKVTSFETPNVITDNVSPITEKSEKYLRKIIEYTRENDIDLYLVAAPYNNIYEDRLERVNYVKELAAKEGILFTDFNRCYDELGLDYSTDLNDDDHLNYYGSSKYSDYLGKVIKENFEIPDRRGLEEYYSWYMDLENIWNQAAEHENE